MHQWLCPAVAGVLLALPMSPGAEVPAELDAAFRNYVALPAMLTPLLAKVKDKESAEAAAEELQRLLPYVYDARYDLGKIQSLSPEVAAELRRRYEKDMRTRWGELYDHIYRLDRVQCYRAPAFSKQFTILCMMLEK